LERTLRRELPLKPLWGALALLLLVPGVIDALPIPAVFTRLGRKLPSGVSHSFPALYLRHELRRGSTWLALFLSVALAALLHRSSAALWVVLAQFPLQRSLYSIRNWRKIAVQRFPENGAEKLLVAIAASQVLQAVICWLALGISGIFGLSAWLTLGPGVLGAAICGSAVALEGDSGQPWIVNFLSLATATIGGYLAMAWPWTLALSVYFFNQMRGLASNRLHSIETLDEDTLIS